MHRSQQGVFHSRSSIFLMRKRAPKPVFWHSLITSSRRVSFNACSTSKCIRVARSVSSSPATSRSTTRAHCPGSA
ncbi:hypothetical protein TYRP_018232 [Tyrophagus putrescentiae]|nr:hypothetical protein TYRP_018232 [Tyrophagus putrescentiae]